MSQGPLDFVINNKQHKINIPAKHLFPLSVIAVTHSSVSGHSLMYLLIDFRVLKTISHIIKSITVLRNLV